MRLKVVNFFKLKKLHNFLAHLPKELQSSFEPLAQNCSVTLQANARKS